MVDGSLSMSARSASREMAYTQGSRAQHTLLNANLGSGSLRFLGPGLASRGLVLLQ